MTQFGIHITIEIDGIIKQGGSPKVGIGADDRCGFFDSLKLDHPGNTSFLTCGLPVTDEFCIFSI